MQDPIADKVKFSEAFDGRFFFTNWTGEDFTTQWNKVQYTFPAMKTSPIVIPSESLEGIQNIRKLFAEQLAEREYQKSDELKGITAKPGQGEALQSSLTYIPLVKDRRTGEWDTRSPLAPLALKCLEALPIASAIQKGVESKEIRTRGSKVLQNAIGTDSGEGMGESLVNGQVVA